MLQVNLEVYLIDIDAFYLLQIFLKSRLQETDSGLSSFCIYFQTKPFEAKMMLFTSKNG